MMTIRERFLEGFQEGIVVAEDNDQGLESSTILDPDSRCANRGQALALAAGHEAGIRAVRSGGRPNPEAAFARWLGASWLGQ